MVTVTDGHFSPKVLMISTVCGRAPPLTPPPKPPLDPPKPPLTDQELLSVMKTLALPPDSCGRVEGSAARTDALETAIKPRAALNARAILLFIKSSFRPGVLKFRCQS